jgi:hypothetical protein
MKYKKRIARLQSRQKAWDAMSNSEQAATTKPGSLNK